MQSGEKRVTASRRLPAKKKNLRDFSRGEYREGRSNFGSKGVVVSSVYAIHGLTRHLKKDREDLECMSKLHTKGGREGGRVSGNGEGGRWWMFCWSRVLKRVVSQHLKVIGGRASLSNSSAVDGFSIKGGRRECRDDEEYCVRGQTQAASDILGLRSRRVICRAALTPGQKRTIQKKGVRREGRTVLGVVRGWMVGKERA